MCGILGVLRRSYGSGATVASNEKMKEMFKNLMELSQSRGSDSSGMFVCNKKSNNTYAYQNTTASEDKIYVNKSSLPAKKYVESNDYLDIIKKTNIHTCAMVGHTRAATSGSPKDNRNNHPIICGNIVGVHNGIITNHKELGLKHNLLLKSNCDSEIIFALVNKFMNDGDTLERAIINMSKEVKGSMACVLTHQRTPKKVAIFRRGNPIHFGYDRVDDYLVFASEQDYILDTYKKTKGKDLSPNFYGWGTIIMGNNTGFVINNDDAIADWVEKSKPFTLGENA